MKLTKQILRKIIKEEYHKLLEAEGQYEIISVDVEIGSTDEWAELSVSIKGNWPADEDLHKQLAQLVMSNKEALQKINAMRGKTVRANQYEDGPMVTKEVPIPKHWQDFEDWEIGDGWAYFGMTDR